MPKAFRKMGLIFIALSLINALFLPFSGHVPLGVPIYIALDWPAFLTLGADEVTEHYGAALAAQLTWLSAEPWLLFCSVVLVILFPPHSVQHRACSSLTPDP